jgi:hypothetical protein
MPEELNKLISNGKHPHDAARQSYVVVPNNSSNLPTACRGLYVGVTGNVKVLLIDDPSGGEGTVFANLVAGVVHPLACRKVFATGTTATSIVAVV